MVVKVNIYYGYGKLLEVDQRSPHLIDAYHQCGGCQLQHMGYELELQMKHNQVINVLKKIAHLDHVPVHEPIGMEHPWHYRHKVQMPVGEKNGRLVTGFYQPRSHRIIEKEKPCNIHEPVIIA